MKPTVQDLRLGPYDSTVSRIGRAGEDRFTIKLLNGLFRMYAVFDGHGGPSVSEMVSSRLPYILAETLLGVDSNSPAQIEARIKQAYLILDKQMYNSKMIDGSTAGVVLITPLHIYLISLGDSKAIIYRENSVLAQSKDTIPGDSEERARIESIGGLVLGQNPPRVGGYLAVSRSFGDFIYKITGQRTDYASDGWVSVIPHITVLNRPGDAWLIVASDGLWEVFTPEVIAAIPQTPQSPLQAGILSEAAAEVTTDDITIIKVRI